MLMIRIVKKPKHRLLMNNMGRRYWLGKWMAVSVNWKRTDQLRYILEIKGYKLQLDRIYCKNVGFCFCLYILWLWIFGKRQ